MASGGGWNRQLSSILPLSKANSPWLHQAGCMSTALHRSGRRCRMKAIRLSCAEQCLPSKAADMQALLHRGTPALSADQWLW